MNQKEFWTRTIERPNGCIEWTGARTPKGYGRLYHESKFIGAHRLAWVFANGPIPDGLSVCHACDNPPCVNLDHLWLGTNADNSADMARKGRARSGINARRQPTIIPTLATFQGRRITFEELISRKIGTH